MPVIDLSPHLPQIRTYRLSDLAGGGISMKQLSSLLALVAVQISGAYAAANFHIFVASTGSDVANCGGIASPCRTLSFGVGQTIASGVLEVAGTLDYIDAFSPVSI